MTPPDTHPGRRQRGDRALDPEEVSGCVHPKAAQWGEGRSLRLFLYASIV